MVTPPLLLKKKRKETTTTNKQTKNPIRIDLLKTAKPLDTEFRWAGPSDVVASSTGCTLSCAAPGNAG